MNEPLPSHSGRGPVPPREAAAALFDQSYPGFASWLTEYYAPLEVHVSTPHGLTAPYRLAHGGGQGDTGGVAFYKLVSVIRTNFHHGILRHRLRPDDLGAGALAANDICFPLPADPTTPVIDICFSDDRQLFARDDRGLAHLLRVVCHGCWATSGGVNFDKLRAFKLCLSGGRLRYKSGVLDTLLGPLAYGGRPMQLVGIPLVMGDTPSEKLRTTVNRLQLIAAGVRRHHPAFVLVLRVISAFALAQLDYIFEATPPPADARLMPVQRATDGVVIASLGIPNFSPRALLHAPLLAGGFGLGGAPLTRSTYPPGSFCFFSGRSRCPLPRPLSLVCLATLRFLSPFLFSFPPLPTFLPGAHPPKHPDLPYLFSFYLLLSLLTDFIVL